MPRPAWLTEMGSVLRWHILIRREAAGPESKSDTRLALEDFIMRRGAQSIHSTCSHVRMSELDHKEG